MSALAMSRWDFMAPAMSGLLALAGMFLVLGILWSVRWWWRRRFREPFYQGILRPPGWGCIERRQDALFDIAGICVAMPFSWGLVGVLAWLRPGDAWLGGLVVVVLASCILLPVLWRQVRRARKERLGFLGECQVAEHLAGLTGDGWRVFHDVPMEVGGRRFNVDHVAVGPGGVVAVETKTFSKARKAIPRGDTLQVEGEIVRLPDSSVRTPLKQAKANAAALRNWLREKSVMVDFVQPVVVLPGWIVSYPRGASELIRDPRNVAAWVRRLPEVLPEARCRQVALLLEEKCRNLTFDR